MTSPRAGSRGSVQSVFQRLAKEGRAALGLGLAAAFRPAGSASTVYGHAYADGSGAIGYSVPVQVSPARPGPARNRTSRRVCCLKPAGGAGSAGGRLVSGRAEDGGPPGAGLTDDTVDTAH